MKIQTVHIATFSIIATTGNGTGQAVSSFVKSASAKAGIPLELRAPPLPEGVDPAHVRWEVELKSDNEVELRRFVVLLRAALELLPVELSQEGDAVLAEGGEE